MPRLIEYREAIREALDEELARDPMVVRAWAKKSRNTTEPTR